MATKKNPPDLTIRNSKAINARISKLAARVMTLERELEKLKPLGQKSFLSQQQPPH